MKSNIEKEFDTYVKKTIINTIINFAKKEMKKRQREVSLEVLFNIPDENTLPFFNSNNQIEELFEDEKLSQIVATLTEEQKNILQMSVIDGFNSKEIANKIGKSDSGVRKTLSRTLKYIRKKYEE